MECDPGAAYAMAQVAVPAAATAFAPQPVIVTPPSSKFTVPVRVPDAGAVAVTVAVYVTVCPLTDGLADAASPVVVPPAFTTCMTAADVLPAYVPLPP